MAVTIAEPTAGTLQIAGAVVLCTLSGGVVTPVTSVGTGDVVGPASSTDNALARFDLTTGKLLKNSAATLDDAGLLIADNMRASVFSSNASGNACRIDLFGGDMYFIQGPGTQIFLSASGISLGGGTAFLKSATYTASMSQSIGTLAEYEQSITATGVAAGDVVALDIPSQPAGIVLAGVRTTTDAILVKFYNNTGGSLSLTGTIKARTFEV